ncbi:hypothetical protein GCM10011533_22620 [Streptosporangium jomthongense]|nr:hypothetical protein GCM10011533_22620 [Streptosporangium jomthongense]
MMMSSFVPTGTNCAANLLIHGGGLFSLAIWGDGFLCPRDGWAEMEGPGQEEAGWGIEF